MIQIIQFIMAISILVILHELGHFIPAKLFKTRVEKFYLFFDPWFSIFKKKIGETEYGIGWLPLGGYVKIAGMVDESMDKEQMNKPPQPWEFRSKPAWQRLIIMVGGVTVNVIVGFIIYAMILFVWGKDYSGSNDYKYGLAYSKTLEKYGFQQGDKILSVDGNSIENVMDLNKYLMVRNVKSVEVEHIDGSKQNIAIPQNIGKELFENGDMQSVMPRFPSRIDSVSPNSTAYKMGIKKNDIIKNINNAPIEYSSQLVYALKNNSDSNLSVQVLRGDSLILLNGKLGEDKVMGIVNVPTDTNFMKINHKKFSFGESIKEGVSIAYWTLRDYASQFKYIFTKKGATGIGGFGSIAKMLPTSWDWPAFWAFTAFLSLALAFMNILPIPALDGGHIMFTIYEMIVGKPAPQKFLEKAQMIGMILLLGLFIYANGLDVFRFFKK